jgi:2'-hydroxyisoflavone reductase
VKLLVIGGSRFLGRHLVDEALARGHEVTLFNRGRSEPGPVSGAEWVKGDRDGGLGALGGRRWDAVVDTCGFVPRVVAASAALLADRVEHYTFISSLSVYADSAAEGQAEDAALSPTAAAGEEVTGESYGPLKIASERAVERALPGRTLVVRPGLIVGPRDYTDRFPYWPRRVARGGEVLAPGRPDGPVQFIDARDLGGWILDMAEARRAGVFNAAGPGEPLTFARFLDACRETLGARAEFTWLDEAFLLEHSVSPFDEMPLWVPSAARGFLSFDFRKAVAAGLVHRPIAETIRDTHAWDAARPPGEPRSRTGLIGPSMTPERERELLASWHARQPA